LAAVVAMGCLIGWNYSAASAETLRIQGSSGFANEVIEPYLARIEALTGQHLSITKNTSGEGLLALLKGETDLAMISASLRTMVARLRESRPDLPFHLLRTFRVAEARVAYPVHPDNPVRSLPLAKLKGILDGQIDNWTAVGGPDLPIHVISLRGGGAMRTTETILLDGQRIAPHSALIVEKADDVVQAVAQDPGALGITRAQLVKLHRLPELQTRVPIVRWYSFVSLDEPTAAMREVIAEARRVVFDEEP